MHIVCLSNLNAMMGREMAKKVFLAYLNEDNEVRSGFVTLINQTDSIVEFDTGSNRIVIPISRLLKLKHRNHTMDYEKK